MPSSDQPGSSVWDRPCVFSRTASSGRGLAFIWAVCESLQAAGDTQVDKLVKQLLVLGRHTGSAVRFDAFGKKKGRRHHHQRWSWVKHQSSYRLTRPPLCVCIDLMFVNFSGGIKKSWRVMLPCLSIDRVLTAFAASWVLCVNNKRDQRSPRPGTRAVSMVTNLWAVVMETFVTVVLNTRTLGSRSASPSHE